MESETTPQCDNVSSTMSGLRREFFHPPSMIASIGLLIVLCSASIDDRAGDDSEAFLSTDRPATSKCGHPLPPSLVSFGNKRQSRTGSDGIGFGSSGGGGGREGEGGVPHHSQYCRRIMIDLAARLYCLLVRLPSAAIGYSLIQIRIHWGGLEAAAQRPSVVYRNHHWKRASILPLPPSPPVHPSERALALFAFPLSLSRRRRRPPPPRRCRCRAVSSIV